MRNARETKDGQALTKGGLLFNTNCASCHALDASATASAAAPQAYPNLKDVGKRLSRQEITAILETGRGRMPAFQHIPREDRTALVNFLLNTEPAASADDIHKVTSVKADAW